MSSPRKREKLIARREELGLSQETFARLVGTDARSVRRWEQGESTPRGFRRAKMAEVLQVSAAGLLDLLELYLDIADLPDLIKVLSDEPQQPTLEEDPSVNRRDFLRAVGIAAGTTATGWIVGPEPARVTSATVDSIAQLTSQLRAFDNRYGGGAARTLATSYLDTEVIPLVRRGGYTDIVGNQLTRAAAQLAQLAGWTCYDQRQHDAADHYLEQALSLAAMAGDEAFQGEVLAGLSHHAVHLARPARALELALAAQDKGSKARVPALMAEAQVLEAQANALLGDRSSAERALLRAEQSWDRIDPHSSPSWLSYCDDKYLASRFAHCFAYVRDWARCATFASRCVKMSPDLSRTRTSNMIMLAHAHVDSDPGQASALGIGALEMAGQLQSTRTIEYLSGLRHRLVDRGFNVEEFDEQATEILGARP